MNGGILGQLGRSILHGRGILVFSENHFWESLRCWNIMVPLKIPTTIPAPDNPLGGYEGAWGTLSGA